MSKKLRYTTPKAAEPGASYTPGPPTVSATDAKNQFAELLEAAIRDGPVFIAKHGSPKAVLISVEEYERLRGPRDPVIEAWRKKYDEMFDRMQQPGWREGMRAAFDMTSEEMGKAAAEAARKRE